MVFEARDELEVAQRYARSMIESGIGELNDMMVARLPVAQDLLLKHIGEKAVRLEESCWALGGPKVTHTPLDTAEYRSVACRPNRLGPGHRSRAGRDGRRCPAAAGSLS